MLVGNKVRVLTEYGFTGIIIKPRARNLPMPGADWFLVKCDDGRGVLCVHRDMLALRND